MKYVALLRGINVGGRNKIEMKRLKAVVERAGFDEVRTYINSGNVVFAAGSQEPAVLAAKIEAAIAAEFGFPVTLLVRTASGFAAVAAALPDDWANDAQAKCDVMFLGDAVDGPGVLDRLVVKPGIDDVRYVPGAILWRVERPLLTRSGMQKLPGTSLYAQMTIRNCTTVRKLDALLR